MKPGQIAKQVANSRIPLRWKNIEQLIVKLADVRGANPRVVELFTDRETAQMIMVRFLRNPNTTISLEQESLLGFHFTSIRCSDDRTELRVVHDRWFDDCRKARMKRGWRKREAYALDWLDVKIAGDRITVSKRNHHRRITFQ